MDHMNRTDWRNEANDDVPAWQLDHDSATRGEIRKLVESLIAIGPAVSRSELETAIHNLRNAYAWNDDLAFTINAIVETVEYYHGQWMARKFSHEAMADDLRAGLEDL